MVPQGLTESMIAMPTLAWGTTRRCRIEALDLSTGDLSHIAYYNAMQSSLHAVWQIDRLTLAYTKYYYKRDTGLHWNQEYLNAVLGPFGRRTDELTNRLPPKTSSETRLS